jgi:Domain of unknown function (DUF4389)
MEATANLYPVTLDVDYPERQSRWKTLLRLFLAIPVLIVAGIIGGLGFSSFSRTGAFAGSSQAYSLSLGAAGSVVLVIWIAIVFRGYIPRWLFSFLVALMRFQTRVFGYFALLTDVYPPFEADHPIRYEVEYPEKPSRWKVLVWKFITSLPHFVVLIFLSIGAFFAVVIAWFAILITGHYPKGLHGYVVGVGRWNVRVQAYLLSLTDEYPPFSLSGNASKAGNDTYVISSVIGVLLFLAMIGGIVVAAVYMPGAKRMDVSYSALLSGQGDGTFATGKTEITLMGGIDPASQSFPYLMPREGKRLVAFKFELTNNRGFRLKVRDSDFRLKDANGKNHSPILAIAGGTPATASVAKHGSASVITIFEVNEQGQPKELRYWAGATESRPVIWEFQ